MNAPFPLRRLATFHRLITPIALCLSFALLLPACGGGESESEDDGPRPHVAEYTVRARVEALPDPARPASEFLAHHEPIPSFRATWPDGPLGMNAMVMPFPPAEGLSLEGIDRGDIVEITFAVTYEAETGAIRDYEMVEIIELPPDTPLTLGTVEDMDPAVETQPDIADPDGSPGG